MFQSIQEIENSCELSYVVNEQIKKNNYKKDVCAEVKRLLNDAVLRKEEYCVIPMVTAYDVYYADVWRDLVEELNKTTDYFCAASGFKEGSDPCYNQFTQSSDVLIVLFKRSSPLSANVVFPSALLILTPIAWVFYVLFLYFTIYFATIRDGGMFVLTFFILFIGACTLTHSCISQYFWEYVPVRNALASQNILKEIKK